MRLILDPHSPKIVVRIAIMPPNTQYQAKAVITFFLIDNSFFLWNYVF